MDRFELPRQIFKGPGASSGLALIWIILIILALIAIFIVGLTAWWNRTPSWYTYDPPNVQTPDSVVVTGPATIVPGAPNTFTLTVSYDDPIGATKNYIVDAEIYEDDIGDVLLDRHVRLRFPAGSTSSSATFDLTCTDPDSDGNYRIVGDNGFNTLDDTWEIFGYVKTQSTSYAEEGSNHNVSCEEP